MDLFKAPFPEEPFSPAHAGRLEISLTNIAKNYNTLQARTKGVEVSGVVKADAYGCGLSRVVHTLSDAGCKTFFVAHYSEGILLRRYLPEAVIYVLNGLPPKTADRFKNNKLRPVLSSLEEVAEWLSADNTSAYALQIDTGMNRLGISLQDIALLPEKLQPNLVMSHFVSSENAQDKLNDLQIEKFIALKSHFVNSKFSLSNSSGLFLKSAPFFDLVRPGYALYGGNPTPNTKNPMHDVINLKALVVLTRKIKKGETVGYNAQWTAKRDSLIATISLGYADGFLRSGMTTDHVNGGFIEWNDALYPFAGRISMDLITVDVTDAPTPPQRGDWVDIINHKLSIDVVAGHLKTNGYEILTSLGKRYARSYV